MIAKIASESGIQTVGAVIAPFGWEGEARLASALRQNGVTTLFSLANEESARHLAPQILPQSVFDVAAQNFDALYRGIVIPLVEPGIFDIEQADVLDVLNQPGVSACGHGIAIGPGAAASACSQAIERSWLGRGHLNAASHFLVHIEGEESLTVSDFQAVCELVQLQCREDAVVVVSMRLRNAPDAGCRVTLLATGAGFEMPAWAYLPGRVSGYS
jgi:cell division GTPase FtsZ